MSILKSPKPNTSLADGYVMCVSTCHGPGIPTCRGLSISTDGLISHPALINLCRVERTCARKLSARHINNQKEGEAEAVLKKKKKFEAQTDPNG